MDTAIKARWIAALTSGEYEQGKEYLSKGGKLCCLGVLCELAVADGLIEKSIRYPDDPECGWVEYGAGQDEVVLPFSVQQWAGLSDANPSVKLEGAPEGVIYDPVNYGGPGEAKPSLAGLNDAGTPFAVIAKVIEQQF